MTDPALISQMDQLIAYTSDEGRRIAAFYHALRESGMPAALAGRLTEQYQYKLLWPQEKAPDIEG